MVRHTPRRHHRVEHSTRVRIVSLRDGGTSLREIARQTHLTHSTVQAVVDKWNRHGTVLDLAKVGRPQKVSDRTKRALERRVEDNEITTLGQMTQVALDDYQVAISRSTARNILRQAGLKAMRTISKPLLNEQHKRRRLDFALAHQHWTVEDWKQVIFSDETMVTARPIHSTSYVWTKTSDHPNPRLVVPSVQGGGSKIMTWGCISVFGFHSMVLLEGSVDSERYIGVLQEDLLPVTQQHFDRQPVVFQQDGASIHTSAATMRFLEDNHIPVLDWPPHSPDLNIIEHVWLMLKRKLKSKRVARNKNELWENVEAVARELWSDSSTAEILNLYESMPNRIQAVIRAHGGNTKY